MKMEEFFAEYPRFSSVNMKSWAESLFAYLTQPEIIARMIITNDYAKLAPLDSVVEEMEMKFASIIEFNKHITVRQMVGAMIKHILGRFGYEPDIRVSIRNGKHFKLAMRYKKAPGERQILKLKQTVTIEEA